jgi:ABC-type transport system involved in multi-copper enzyme maturation permease subunit
MTISTAAMNAGLYPRSERSSIFYVLWLLLPGIVIGWNAVGSRFAKRWAYILSVMVLLLLALSLLSCGGASNGGTTPPPTGKQPTTYQITVTGTSSGTAPDSGQSAVVTLVVN